MKVEIPLKEEWRDIKGFEGYYQVSNCGNIKSVDREILQKHYSGCISHYILKGKIKKLQKQKNGYLIIDLNKNGKFIRKLVHRLVAENFIDNPKGYSYVNHKDNNPKNNQVDNLEWCTQSYNVKYAYENWTKTPPNMKPIRQLKGGKTIAIYNSISEAQRMTGICFANISKCCRKLRNYAGGYQWEYIQQK